LEELESERQKRINSEKMLQELTALNRTMVDSELKQAELSEQNRQLTQQLAELKRQLAEKGDAPSQPSSQLTQVRANSLPSTTSPHYHTART